MPDPNRAALYRLAQAYGVQVAYNDVFGRRRQASPEALLAVLQALGAPLAGMADVPSAWRKRQLESLQDPLAPVLVAWDGRLARLEVKLPAGLADMPIAASLRCENGETKSWRITDATIAGSVEIEGRRFVARQASVPGDLLSGYHRLRLEVAGRSVESLIISAPLKAYRPPENGRAWGAFIPLYALHGRESWGAGDYSDLAALAGWTGDRGGQAIGTLPLLPVFLENPSPYLPVSRLFWSEFYIDITRVPELQGCTPARELLASPAWQDEIGSLRRLPLVDYRRQMALKRRALEELSRSFFAAPSGRLDELHDFINEHETVKNYARFRAVQEKQGRSWREWPADASDPETERYYLYAQWLAHQQVESAAGAASRKGVKLYLDLPLGTHRDGYDVWSERDAFAPDVSAGAPPDAVFPSGQDWTFPPLHPQRLRRQGYRYLINCLCHHMQPASMLRLDHVMGLHRLYWIPKGMSGREGVYVRYAPDEMYAVLNLESHRHQTVLAGEDLGTVPQQVKAGLERHGWRRMYVLHYELASGAGAGLNGVPANTVASLNTHDMPPFAAFWSGQDIEHWRDLGLLDEAGAEKEREKRQALRRALACWLRRQGFAGKADMDASEALEACLSFLSASQAGMVLVGLEDLWLETGPQNIPGTTSEYPNWRRRARYTIEDFSQMPRVLHLLKLVSRLRRG